MQRAAAVLLQRESCACGAAQSAGSSPVPESDVRISQSGESCSSSSWCGSWEPLGVVPFGVCPLNACPLGVCAWPLGVCPGVILPCSSTWTAWVLPWATPVLSSWVLTSPCTSCCSRRGPGNAAAAQAVQRIKSSWSMAGSVSDQQEPADQGCRPTAAAGPASPHARATHPHDVLGG